MNSFTFTIEAGDRSRQMSEAGLAILLGLNPADIRRRVTWYLGHGSSPWGTNSPTAQPEPVVESPGEGGKGGMGHVNGDVERNVNENDKENIDSNVNDTDETFLNATFGEGEGLGEETPPRDISLAERLAKALSDPSSLHCYERLVLQHPPERLERALELTLVVPVERLKKSRGAYFMGVVRTLAKTASLT